MLNFENAYFGFLQYLDSLFSFKKRNLLLYKTLYCISVVDLNTLNLDPDLEFWPNLDYQF